MTRLTQAPDPGVWGGAPVSENRWSSHAVTLHYTSKTPKNMSMLSGRSSIHRESSSPKAMRIRHGCQSFVTAFSVGGRTRPTCTRDHGAKFGNPHRYLRARCMARAPHSVSADLPHTIMRPSHRPSAWTTRPPTKDASGTRYESWPMALFRGVCWRGVGRPCSSVTRGFSGSLTHVCVLYVCLSGVDHMATHQRRASRAAQAWQYRLHWVEWFWHTVWPQRQALALHPVADSCILYVAHDWRVCLVGSQAMSYACMRRGMLASSVWLGRLPTGAPFPTTLLRCGSV